jgi:hypothetical protein
MRGSRVRWSPDSSADEGMRTRPNAENPGARKIYPQISTAIHKMIASGKPSSISLSKNCASAT